MKSTKVFLLLAFVACLLAHVDKISADSLLDMLSAEMDDNISEDITTRRSMACTDVRSKRFCSRFRRFCGQGTEKNLKFMLQNCRRTCGCVYYQPPNKNG
ncbi:aurelin-like [Stylophora pistillata]|uniref:ShKT domain-containing protein n=1 Tax=Stylophora pistillata TaxID=50429 RepID=A0A2B4SFX4_STYPI|nr:aurelin-like [Stylophora pistillata]PFX27943.1 hypothetical protein AWC38_SpisGene7349 [Stylophora pistillata]